SAGVTSVAIKQDLDLLLQNVGTGAGSRLFIFTTSAICKAWSVVPEAGPLTFPNLTYRGGEVAGIQVIPSDVVAPGEVWLCDASALVTSTDGNVRLDTATEATLNMLDSPDSPATGTTVLYPLWQYNAVGVIAERYLAAKLVRSNGAAKVT